MLITRFITFIVLTILTLNPIFSADDKPREQENFHRFAVTTVSSGQQVFKREFGQLLQRVTARHKIKVVPVNREWAFVLQKDDLKRIIFYYDFDINPTGAFRSCKDKTTTSELLTLANIPNVEHKLFVTPAEPRYAPSSGVWPEIMEFARSHNFNVVCKPSDGSGGLGVSRATTLLQVEKLYIDLMHEKYDFSMAPYYDIEDEPRIIMIKEEPQVVYRKARPEVVGNNLETVRQLFITYLESLDKTRFTVFFDDFDARAIKWDRVLGQGERYPLKWKHNLEGGSKTDLNVADDLQDELVAIAMKTMKALNVNFASVDIIRTAGQWKVLEVNAGVMMKHFMQQNGGWGMKLAEAIYEKAICKMFDLQLPDESRVKLQQAKEHLMTLQ